MYEPWFITHWDVMPWFHSDFKGYGMNKIVFVASLHYYGHSFEVRRALPRLALPPPLSLQHCCGLRPAADPPRGLAGAPAAPGYKGEPYRIF
jgi:hypothetical protein